VNYCPECASPLQTRATGGVERRVCTSPQCGFVHWDNPVPVVAALVERHDEIVFARNAAWPHGVFSVVTGYLEKNETTEAAVAREVNEELGLNAQVVAFLGHFPFFQKNQLILAYRVIGDGEVAVSDEIAEIKSVRIANVDTLPIIETFRRRAAKRSGVNSATTVDGDFGILPLAAWCWERCNGSG